ncbi:hypothetical protein M1D46_06265 [Microbacterium sp. JZ70]
MTPDDIRRLSRAASPDPFPLQLPTRGERTWLYTPGAYARGVLNRLVAESRASARFVHYDDNQRPAASRVRFRADDGEVVECVATEGEPAALCDDGRGWRVEADGAWVAPDIRPGRDRPPHLDPGPSFALEPIALGAGLHDAGATVLARPVIASGMRPAIRVGESLAEVEADGDQEAIVEIVRRADGAWTTQGRLGFRYLRVDDPAAEVHLEAFAHPVERGGAFACSDEDLTRMWAVAAYTTRASLQGLAVDGLKRDRVPWAGDQALALLANAYAIGDGGIAFDSLDALGAPDGGYVNGLADYSLWWVVAQGLHMTHFGDSVSARRRADAVARMLDTLACDVDSDGVFRPGQPSGFPAGPVLIDWGVDTTPGRDLAALQVLFAWAARTGADLLARGGHPDAARWREVAVRAERVLRERAWDERGFWREHLDADSGPSAYPNLLAILAGLGVSDGVVDAVRDGRVRTPYMTGFAAAALVTGGCRDDALALLRRRWQPMLDAGATTFWEEFAEPGHSPYEMYGRPFGKSLCHAWGAAPAALLPWAVLGIEPRAAGWREVAVAPALGDLTWAAAVVPTPHGDLTVHAEGDVVMVDVPTGIRITGLGDDVVGPTRVERRAASTRGTT